MWQQIVAAVLVLLAALFAAWKLAPQRWRRRSGLIAPEPPVKPGACGCGPGKDGCH